MTTTELLRHTVRGRGAHTLLLHAACWPVEAWTHQLTRRGAARCRVIQFWRGGDRRRHGAAAFDDGDALTEALDRLIMQYDLHDITLVSAVEGAPIALHYLGSYGATRVGRLVLIAAGPSASRGRGSWQQGGIRRPCDTVKPRVSARLLHGDSLQLENRRLHRESLQDDLRRIALPALLIRDRPLARFRATWARRLGTGIAGVQRRAFGCSRSDVLMARFILRFAQR